MKCEIHEWHNETKDSLMLQMSQTAAMSAETTEWNQIET